VLNGIKARRISTVATWLRSVPMRTRTPPLMMHVGADFSVTFSTAPTAIVKNGLPADCADLDLPCADALPRSDQCAFLISNYPAAYRRRDDCKQQVSPPWTVCLRSAGRGRFSNLAASTAGRCPKTAKWPAQGVLITRPSLTPPRICLPPPSGQLVRRNWPKRKHSDQAMPPPALVA